MLGAVAQVTERMPLMTYVTCPTFRYHPAVVAQKAATMALLSGGRFRLGLGAGENLNEHVVGQGWPLSGVRHEMLTEAIQIIRRLFEGRYVDFHGEYFRVESAKLWDLPDEPVKIGVAVSGPASCALAGQHADYMVAVEPKAELGSMFDSSGGSRKARVGQLGIAYGTDTAAARQRAHEQFRWFGGGWPVNAELPGPSSFDAASQSVTEDEVAEQIPCGSDVDAVVEAVKQFTDAGFGEVALVQIGGDQQDPFFDWAESDLLPALRKL